MSGLVSRLPFALSAALMLLGSVNALGAQASGFAALTLSKPTYQLGEKVRLCYTLPGPGKITITQTDDHGAKQVLLAQDDDGNTDCVSFTEGGEPGHACARLDYGTTRGSGTLEACFDVVRNPAPAPQPTADSPVLILSPDSGPAGTQFKVDGAGFQDFLQNMNGVFLSVGEAGTGRLLDLTQMPPSLDGSLHLVLNSANYPPGEYMLMATYTGLIGGDRTPQGFDPMFTFKLMEPVYLTITP